MTTDSDIISNYLKNLLRVSPKDPLLKLDIFELHRLAQDYRTKGYDRTVHSIVNAILKKDPNDLVAKYQLGETLRNMGEEDKAEEIFRHVFAAGHPRDEFEELM